MSDVDGGGAVNSVKEAFQGKRGKVLLIGGGVAIAVYVWWTRRNGTPQPAVPADPTVTDGPSGRTPQTDPEVGNTSTGTLGPRKYTNNADWLSDGTDFLKGRGTPAGAAYDALTKALGGLQVTSQESAWVSQVIGALGAPPEGMPPLNAQAPPTTTPPTTGKPLPAGAGWDFVRKGDTLAKIAARWHTTVSALRTFNTANALNRLVPGEPIRIRGKAGPPPKK